MQEVAEQCVLWCHNARAAITTHVCSVHQCRGPCAVGCECINPSQALWSTAVSSWLRFGINARLFGIKAAPATQPGLGAGTPGVVLCTGSAVVTFPYFPNRLPALDPC